MLLLLRCSGGNLTATGGVEHKAMQILSRVLCQSSSTFAKAAGGRRSLSGHCTIP